MAAEQYPRLRPIPAPTSAEAKLSGECADLFHIDDITVGAHAHGFGTTEDGRSFSFRVVAGTMTLRVYRSDLDSTAVPSREDVAEMARARVTEVDLADERSVIAMVRDMLAHAAPPAPPAEESWLDRLRGLLFGRSE